MSYFPNLDFEVTIDGDPTRIRVKKDYQFGGDWELWIGGEFCGHHATHEDALEALEPIAGIRASIVGHVEGEA